MGIISHKDAVAEAVVTLEVGTSDNLEKLQSIQTPQPYAEITPVAGRVELRVDFATPQHVAAAGVVGHNMAPTAGVSVHGMDRKVITAIAAADTYRIGHFGRRVASGLRLHFGGLTGVLRIGKLWLADTLDVEFEEDWGLSQMDASLRGRVGATPWPRRRGRPRRLRVSLADIDDPIARQVREILQVAGTSRPVLVWPRSDEPHNAVYGLVDEGWNADHASGPYHRADFSVTEIGTGDLYREYLGIYSGVSLTNSGGTRINALGLIEAVPDNTPRIDHDPSTGQPRGLLIEPASTNVLLQSQDFSDVAWQSTSQISSVESSTDVAPDGTLTADRLKDDDDVTNLYVSQFVTISPDSSSWTGSVWLKQGTAARTEIRLGVELGANTFADARVDWATRTLEAGGGTGDIGIVEDDGVWMRVFLTVQNDGSNNRARMRIWPASEIGASRGTVIAWGAQIENLNRPTSYIPTTNATASRTVDAGIIEAPDFNDFWSLERGTFIVEWVNNTAGVFPAFMVYAADASSPNEIRFSDLDGGGFRWVVRQAGTSTPITDKFGGNQGTFRSALSWGAGQFFASHGGGALQTLAASVPQGIDRLSIGQSLGGNAISKTAIRTLVYYPTELPADTLRSAAVAGAELPPSAIFLLGR